MVEKLDIDNNILTYENINVSIELSIDDRSVLNDDPFMERMYENYSIVIEEFKEAIQNRDQYEITPEMFPEIMDAIRIYDQSLQVSEPNLKARLELTALWRFFNSVSIDYRFYTTDEKGVDQIHMNTIMEYLERKYCPVVFHNLFYVYVENQYYEDRFNKISKDIERILKNCNNYSDKRKVRPIIDDIIYRAKSRWQKHGEITPFNRVKNIIPVMNGVLFINGTTHIFPNSPVWGYTFALPVKYDPTANPSTIKKFISDVCHDPDALPSEMEEKERILYQIPAHALMQQTAAPCYLLSGGGANGKSTYIKFLIEFVGIGNCAAVSIQEIITDKFKAAELFGKLFNLYADLPKEIIQDTGKFKIVTGDDMVNAEKKFKDPFKFFNKAVTVYSSNELPQVHDNTFSFWRRWNIIDFKMRFEKNDTFFEELNTMENKSAFLNIVLEQMKLIKREGLFTGKKSEDIMKQWKENSNSAYSFIVNMIVKDPKSDLKRSDITSAYHTYCDENELTELTKHKLYEELQKEFNVSETQTTIDRKVERMFKGLKIQSKEKDIVKTQTEQSSISQ